MLVNENWRRFTNLMAYRQWAGDRRRAVPMCLLLKATVPCDNTENEVE